MRGPGTTGAAALSSRVGRLREPDRPFAESTDPFAGSAETRRCEADEGCITCGDVASELEVLAVDADRGLALCADAQGRRETVEVALVGPVEVGLRLLVHAGTAIASLNTGGSG